MTARLSPEIFAIYFSAYSAHALKIDGVVYPTLEHAYHCLRYADPRIIEEIRAAHSLVKAWEISQKYKKVQKSDFSRRKLEVMEMLQRKKLEQHEDVRKALIDSNGMEIVKHIITGPPGDGFWDDGADGKGENYVGKIWMKLRSELHS